MQKLLIISVYVESWLYLLLGISATSECLAQR